MAQKKTFVRKQVFINRHLQGRYMLTFFIPMAVMLVFWILTIYFASQSIITTTMSIVERDINDRVAIHLQDVRDPGVDIYKAMVADIQNYVDEFARRDQYKKAIISSLLWIFGTGIFLVIIQIVLLTIFFSHRLAGPIYRFEKACHSLIAGNYTEEIFLRKHDEMKNLASLINSMVAKTRTRFCALRDARSDEEKSRVLDTLKL
ncbi:MAG: hypothetical protein GF398_16370 [Chitinivibrionales bacterium]|nr:hypothetical protein [Chitinivibrionales bacterium]